MGERGQLVADAEAWKMEENVANRHGRNESVDHFGTVPKFTREPVQDGNLEKDKDKVIMRKDKSILSDVRVREGKGYGGKKQRGGERKIKRKAGYKKDLGKLKKRVERHDCGKKAGARRREG